MSSFVIWGTATPPLDGASDLEADAARDTDIAIVPDEQEAMEDAPPEANSQPEVDPRVRLGLATRTTASYVVDSEQFAPGWMNDEFGYVQGNEIPDAGYTAERVAAGEFGHGTMKYAVGIEPVIGAAPGFGEAYFVVNERDIQPNETAEEWGVQPTGYAPADLAQDSSYAAYAMDQARKATESSAMYEGLWA